MGVAKGGSPSRLVASERCRSWAVLHLCNTVGGGTRLLYLGTNGTLREGEVGGGHVFTLMEARLSHPGFAFSAASAYGIRSSNDLFPHQRAAEQSMLARNRKGSWFRLQLSTQFACARPGLRERVQIVSTGDAARRRHTGIRPIATARSPPALVWRPSYTPH